MGEGGGAQCAINENQCKWLVIAAHDNDNVK